MADNYNSLYTGPEIDASVGKVLTTQDAWDGAVAAQLPAGGAEGQILVKTGEADYAAGWKTPVFVRPNLLDNWYFGEGVINQRIQDSFQATDGKYFDRWKSNYTSGGISVTMGTDCVELKTTTFSSGSNRRFQQVLNTPVTAGTFTFSALVESCSGEINIGLGDSGSTYVCSIEDPGLVYKTVTIGSSTFISFRAMLKTNCTLEVKAFKLERGDTQTLAHLENGEWVLNEIPNQGIELLKCQRYFQVFRTQALRQTYAEDFRPVMAADPTLGSFDYNGVTYYTASAEP